MPPSYIDNIASEMAGLSLAAEFLMETFLLAVKLNSASTSLSFLVSMTF